MHRCRRGATAILGCGGQVEGAELATDAPREATRVTETSKRDEVGQRRSGIIEGCGTAARHECLIVSKTKSIIPFKKWKSAWKNNLCSALWHK